MGERRKEEESTKSVRHVDLQDGRLRNRRRHEIDTDTIRQRDDSGSERGERDGYTGIGFHASEWHGSSLLSFRAVDLFGSEAETKGLPDLNHSSARTVNYGAIWEISQGLQGCQIPNRYPSSWLPLANLYWPLTPLLTESYIQSLSSIFLKKCL